MYAALKSHLLRILRTPESPPEPPAGGSVEIFRASPRFLRLQVTLHLASLGSALAFEVAGWLFVPDPSGGIATATTLASGFVIMSTLLVLVVRYFLIRLDYDVRYYLLTDRSLRIRRGALTIEESTYTFANVQNISLRQGPLERLFGITNLHVETAGGGPGGEGPSESRHGMFHRGRLEGIEPGVAERLRDQIIGLVTLHRDSGLGEPAPMSPPKELETAPSGSLHRACLRDIVDELRRARELAQVE